MSLPEDPTTPAAGTPEAPAKKSRRGRRRRTTKRSRAFRWVRIGVLGIVGVLVVALIAGGMFALHLKHNIETEPIVPKGEKTAVPTNGINILLLGSDTRNLKEKSYGAAGNGARSDSMVVVHIAKDNTRIDAIQIPRDTLSELPACPNVGHGAFAGGYGMMNSLLGYGPSCTVAAIEKLTGLPIHHFIEVNFDGFSTMVNALGGVNVCLDKPLVDTDAKLNLPAGKQKLDGKQALALARVRHAIGDGSDIGRLGHQQVVMSAIIDQAKHVNVLTRPDRLFKFLNAVTKSLTVDPGLSSIGHLTSLAKRVSGIPSKKITFVTMPWAAAPSDPNRVVPTPAATTLFKAIKADEPLPLAGSSTVKNAVRTAPVTFVNVSGIANKATDVSTVARGFGYTVGGLSLGATQAKTKILVGSTAADLATAKTLAKELGLPVTPVVSATTTGVRLEIGADYDSIAKDGGKISAPVTATHRTASASICA